ncbi:MAG: hypothetical protein EOP34_03140 [Rickettsiales bacterium]|nr:MAG: hypothetical protein EOP34_03140 [Rickettsiales bacterium]
MEYFNLRNDFPKLTHILDPVKIGLDDAWLSGFTDAEGCFAVKCTANSRYSTGYVFKIVYLLDQNCQISLERILNLLGFGSVSKRAEKKYTFRYHSSGFDNMLKVADYFKRYNLRTKKAQAFENWTVILEGLNNKDHLSPEGCQRLRALAKQVNLINSCTTKIGSALKDKNQNYKI